MKIPERCIPLLRELLNIVDVEVDAVKRRDAYARLAGVMQFVVNHHDEAANYGARRTRK